MPETSTDVSTSTFIGGPLRQLTEPLLLDFIDQAFNRRVRHARSPVNENVPFPDQTGPGMR